MKPLIVAALLVLAAPAVASVRPPTPAQEKDLQTIYRTFGACTENEKLCDTAHKLMKKLEKQGFCFYKRLVVGRTGKRYTQAEWDQLIGSDPGTEPVPKNAKHCDPLHEPTP
jgi:hypothetical protein